MTYSDDESNDYELVSKTEMKKEAHQVQALGERLLTLRPDQLATVPMTERLASAIEESRRIKQREARRRHLQFIGKLMRDNDIEAIQVALDRLDPSSQTYLREQQQAEAWREKLIKQESAEAEWFENYPQTDRQHFRSLIRAARKEQPEDASEPIRSGKNTTRLLKQIRHLMTA